MKKQNQGWQNQLENQTLTLLTNQEDKKISMFHGGKRHVTNFHSLSSRTFYEVTNL